MERFWKYFLWKFGIVKREISVGRVLLYVNVILYCIVFLVQLTEDQSSEYEQRFFRMCLHFPSDYYKTLLAELANPSAVPIKTWNIRIIHNIWNGDVSIYDSITIPENQAMMLSIVSRWNSINVETLAIYFITAIVQSSNISTNKSLTLVANIN